MNSCVDIKTAKPAERKLRNIQYSYLNILDQVDTICKRHNLCYWLDAGTLLGSIRHKGFISWDDDIDICMPRKDYNKMLSILKSSNLNCQIRLKAPLENNFQIRIIAQNNLAALDIFPVDNYITTNLGNTQKAQITKLIKKARNIFDKKFPSQKFKPNKLKRVEGKTI